MKKDSFLFYFLIATAIIGLTLAVSDPFDLNPVYAEDVKPNPIVLQDSKNDYYYEYGQLTKSIHKTYDRLLDYFDENNNPKYVDYKITEYPTYINYESAQYSATLDKGTCEFRQYQGGKLTGNDSPLMKLNHLQKSALNGTDNWNDETVNNENCIVEIQNRKLIATKNNVVDLGNNQTDGTGFATIYDLDQNGFEWTYENVNLNSNYTDQKFGNTFVCEGADCGNIIIDGETISVGETKQKNEIVGKNIRVGNSKLDLKENQHGYTWALKRTDTNKMIIDFTDSKGSLGYGEKLVIDPVMDFTGADATRRTVLSANDATNGKDCSDADDPNVTGFTKTTDNTTGTQNQCAVMVLVFDLSDPSLDDAVITQARVRYDIDIVSASTVSGAWSAVDRDYDSSTAEQMYRDIVGDTDGGADGDNSPTIYVDDIANMKTVATDYIDILGSDANTDITNAIGGEFYLGSVWGSSESVYTGVNEYFNWSTNADVELELTYETISLPEKPTGLSTEALPFALNGTWTGCESDGQTENSCSLINGVSVWNHTNFHYADLPLPDNAGTDTELGSVTNAIDFSLNKIYYRLDNADSNDEIQDFSGSNNNATRTLDTVGYDLTHSGDPTSDFITGKVGSNAWDFDRADSDYAHNNSVNISFTDDSDWALGFWAYRNDHTSHMILLKLVESTGSHYLNVWYHSGNSPRVYLYDSNSSPEIHFGTALSDAVWQHWIVQRVGGNIQLYVDNVNKIDTASTGSINAFDTLTIAGVSGGDWLNGRLDEVFILDRSLTSAERSDLQTMSVPDALSSTDDLISYYDFEQDPNGNPPQLIDQTGDTPLLFTTGLIDNAQSTYPLNFTSTDSLTENNNDFAIGGFVNQTDTNDFNLLTYNTSSSGVPTEIGLNGSYLYVRNNNNDLATWSNTCNTNSWCHVMIDRASNIFEAFLNGSSLGTVSDSTDLGTAQNNYFIIGGNNTLYPTSTSTLDEFFINAGSEKTQVSAISERGLNDPIWIENIGNQTYAYIDGLNTNEESFYRITLMNTRGNGTYSDLMYGTTDNLPDAPTLSANPVSKTQIDLTRVAGASNGGDPVVTYDLRCELNGAGGWLSTVTDGAIVNSYNYTGLGSGDSLVCQWRDTNGVGDSAWSANATASTFADTQATITTNTDVVGNMLLIEPTITIDFASPSPATVSNVSIYFNNTLQESYTISQNIAHGNSFEFQEMFYAEIPDFSNYNATIRAIISNNTGTITFENSGDIIAQEYDPTFVVQYSNNDDATLGNRNYTIDDTDPANRILKVNRPIDSGLWKISCYTVTGLNNQSLQEYSATDVGFFKQTLTANAGDTLYGTCVNPPDRLFTFVSYGNLTGILAGFSGFDDALGSWFGLPMVFMFVFFLAGLFGGRQSGTGLVIFLAGVAVLGAIGLLVIDETIWGIIITMGAFGLLASRIKF